MCDWTERFVLAQLSDLLSCWTIICIIISDWSAPVDCCSRALVENVAKDCSNNKPSSRVSWMPYGTMFLRSVISTTVVRWRGTCMWHRCRFPAPMSPVVVVTIVSCIFQRGSIGLALRLTCPMVVQPPLRLTCKTPVIPHVAWPPSSAGRPPAASASRPRPLLGYRGYHGRTSRPCPRGHALGSIACSLGLGVSSPPWASCAHKNTHVYIILHSLPY